MSEEPLVQDELQSYPAAFNIFHRSHAGNDLARARVLDGKSVSSEWQDELSHEVASMKQQGHRAPGLGVVLVGERPDSTLYVSRKQEACSRVSIADENFAAAP